MYVVCGPKILKIFIFYIFKYKNIHFRVLCGIVWYCVISYRKMVNEKEDLQLKIKKIYDQIGQSQKKKVVLKWKQIIDDLGDDKHNIQNFSQALHRKGVFKSNLQELYRYMIENIHAPKPSLKSILQGGGDKGPIISRFLSARQMGNLAQASTKTYRKFWNKDAPLLQTVQPSYGNMLRHTSLYIQKLKHFKSLQELTLNLGRLQDHDDYDMRVLTSIIPLMTKLKIINLHLDDRWKEDETVAFISLFSSLTNLEEISLTYDDHEFSDKVMYALASVLRSSKNLRKLFLNSQYSFRKGRIGVEGMRALASVLPSLTKLEHLDLRNCRLTFEGMKALASALPSLKNLNYLDLSYNKVSVRTLTLLGELLKETPGLVQLDLDNMGFGKNGMVILIDGLSTLKNLRRLSLSHNDIDVEGVRVLASILPRLTKLESLEVAENAIGNEGAMILMGLTNSKTHIYILEENEIGQEGELNEDVIKGYEFVMNNRKKRDK